MESKPAIDWSRNQSARTITARHPGPSDTITNKEEVSTQPRSRKSSKPAQGPPGVAFASQLASIGARGKFPESRPSSQCESVSRYRGRRKGHRRNPQALKIRKSPSPSKVKRSRTTNVPVEQSVSHNRDVVTDSCRDIGRIIHLKVTVSRGRRVSLKPLPAPGLPTTSTWRRTSSKATQSPCRRRSTPRQTALCSRRW